MSVRGEHGSQSLAWATVISLALHGLVAGAVLFALRLSSQVPTAPSLAAIVTEVSLVSASPAVHVERELPPAPERQESDPQVAAAKPVVTRSIDVPTAPLAPDPAIKVPPAQPQVQRDIPTEPRPDQQASAPTSVVAPIAEEVAVQTVGQSNNPPADAEQRWEGLVLAALERRKRYPPAARSARQQDVILVRLTIDRKGNVSGAQIRRSQGFGLLDNEVLGLVRRASPLPPPPQQVPGEQIALTVPVEFFLRPGGGR